MQPLTTVNTKLSPRSVAALGFHGSGRAGAAALFVLLWACSSAPHHPLETKHVAGDVRVWVSSADRKQLLWRAADLPLRAATPGSPTIDIEVRQRFQAMVGFGAAITDASAFLIEQRMSG